MNVELGLLSMSRCIIDEGAALGLHQRTRHHRSTPCCLRRRRSCQTPTSRRMLAALVVVAAGLRRTAQQGQDLCHLAGTTDRPHLQGKWVVHTHRAEFLKKAVQLLGCGHLQEPDPSALTLQAVTPCRVALHPRLLHAVEASLQRGPPAQARAAAAQAQPATDVTGSIQQTSVLFLKLIERSTKTLG